jgi:hypothetical protein
VLNIFGSSSLKFVPSFSWGGASGFTTYITKKHLKQLKNNVAVVEMWVDEQGMLF